jgi:hypothetical protein
MATYSDLIKGLTIFQAHEGDKHIGGAEHDIIYVSTVEPSKLSEAQLKDLEEAGFHWDEDNECWVHYA